MNEPVRKTRFQYKSIMRQIMEWREAYVLEYDSFPTVITMDPETRLELEKYICAQQLLHAPFPTKGSTEDYIMGMLIEVSDD
jgi:hypothetical protein